MTDSKEKKSRKSGYIKPALPSGFRDAAPADMIAKQEMIDAIRGVFEKFGFDPMETPAVERTEVLVGGEGEARKIIFNVKGSEEKTSEISLRFDLTVPLARFLAANQAIPRPFKRYQIGKVWRGERPQAGRYREFLQMDIDIVGAKSLDADAEIVQVMYETMRALAVDDFVIRLNNKEEAVRLLRGFGIPEAKIIPTLIAADKRDKLPPAKWGQAVADASGLSGARLKEYLRRISGENMPETAQARALRERAEALGVPPKYLKYDAALVRGLGYYTGSVFETVITSLPSIGSVFSGGRFDGLTARFSKENLPAVGASIGVDRLFAALETLGKVKKKQTLTQALVLNIEPRLAAEYFRILAGLRRAGIRSSLYLGDDRAFQAQLAYAVKKEIPFAVIYGEREAKEKKAQIKSTAAKTQEAVPFGKISSYIKSRLPR